VERKYAGRQGTSGNSSVTLRNALQQYLDTSPISVRKYNALLKLTDNLDLNMLCRKITGRWLDRYSNIALVQPVQPMHHYDISGSLVASHVRLGKGQQRVTAHPTQLFQCD
jgi:hypothetical protein